VTFTRAVSFYQVRLERGEEVVAALGDFVRRRRVGCGIVTGIGAADSVELGLFDPKKRAYVRNRYRGDWEIVSILGNVAWLDKEPVCHLHCIIADREQQCRGGHLYSAQVSVTCELTVQPGTRRIRREPDPATGLNLLALPFTDGD
jgi:predicted DNA-binding protein with PD1-like motif